MYKEFTSWNVGEMAGWVLKKLIDIADFNPRESIAKETIAKKVAMDKLRPFGRNIPEYECSHFPVALNLEIAIQ